MATPTLTYSYFSYGKMKSDASVETVVLDHLPTTENIKVSYNSGFNSLTIKFTSDTSLDYYEVRSSLITDDYGIGIGNLLYYTTSIPGDGTVQTFAVDVNSTGFPSSGEYRIGLYGKAYNGYWDVTYILLSSDDYIIAPNDKDGIEMLTTQSIPN